MQWTNYDHPNKNSKGQDKLKRRVNTESMGIYFFFAVMLTCFIIAILGSG